MWAAALGSIAGSLIDGLVSKNNADNNIKMQKQFAQQGIQWKVADAQKAGIHPLAALGAQTHSFSPVNVGSNFSQAGQDIGRAMQSTQTEPDKNVAMLQKLQIQRAELENTMLASQIAKYNQPATPPSMPTLDNRSLIGGQGNSPLVKATPLEVTPQDPAHPGQEPAAMSDTGWAKDADGNFAVIPSKEAKDRIEDSFIYETQHAIRNQLVPPSNLRPGRPLPGYTWRRNPLTGRWWQVRLPRSGDFYGIGPGRTGQFRGPSHWR